MVLPSDFFRFCSVCFYVFVFLSMLRCLSFCMRVYTVHFVSVLTSDRYIPAGVRYTIEFERICLLSAQYTNSLA